MAWRDGVVAGVAARIFRVSFSGELCFEVDVPAHYGRYVWERLMEAGAEFDITPYGTEAMHVLRAEKGFIIVGQDTDGSVTPVDAGMAWALDKNPPFSYLGRRSLQRSDCVRPDRKQLVGLRSVDDVTVLPEGAQIVNQPGPPPLPMQGHVTSSYWSAHLERPVALALVKGGRGRSGEVVHCPLADGRCVAARIVRPRVLRCRGRAATCLKARVHVARGRGRRARIGMSDFKRSGAMAPSAPTGRERVELPLYYGYGVAGCAGEPALRMQEAPQRRHLVVRGDPGDPGFLEGVQSVAGRRAPDPARPLGERRRHRHLLARAR